MKRDRTKTKQNSKSGCCNIVEWMFVCESYVDMYVFPFKWNCIGDYIGGDAYA